ncbi:toll/interleukin-1 receptor domain-containing protein [Tsukamurella sp. 8F]|uniref:toll/interleukin-1 receptor domain-containing protein n=1 Tax=unclassified Tsukamurella TaxID=2633480 RepID=UPI0023B89FB1|nr:MULTISPECIES: toll/interleukin-1 receptor domain-containing protein [unclassified Tsukamurella]MDF0528590.1 toll/interleukin-1 receptor domain-containing protein [Tsukamurella sp. 8J]MDF0585552.1 toll/interleukin-1 receptor domain-containing protein [Tsukamurella sp. 8F]
MGADLFISYAWTSEAHREWVRLLAAQLKALGFDVLIDADVDYGDDLNGFMRRVSDCKRVLLIVDQNYVQRADTIPESGVGKENRWIAEVDASREAAWLSALFVDNRSYVLPAWLGDRMPKGFDFNHAPGSQQESPGAEQIEDLWRWAAGLPANLDSATPIATLRERATRLEHQDLRSDPTQWRSPDLAGETHFVYEEAPQKTFRWGVRHSEFALQVSGCADNSVYVYKGPIKAVGLVRVKGVDHAVAQQLTPGQSPSLRASARVSCS